MKPDGRLARPLAWLRPRSPGLYRFLTSHERPTPAIREAIGGLLVILLLVTVLWGATGQPLNRSPVVVIETGSMMRCDQGLHLSVPSATCEGPYGRLGTIDPGDLIFVKDIDAPGDVVTAVGCIADDARQRYGACGDTIIYQPGGSAAKTPIIHRVALYLELHGNGIFSVPECGIERQERATVMASPCVQAVLPTGTTMASSFSQYLGKLATQHPYTSWTEAYSGFVTLGDNNPGIDQGSNIAPMEPVRTEWVLGKARGELPWIGLLKLFVTDLFGPSDNYAAAAGDTKVLMWVTIGLIVGGPVAYERFARHRREADESDASDQSELER